MGKLGRSGSDNTDASPNGSRAAAPSPTPLSRPKIQVRVGSGDHAQRAAMTSATSSGNAPRQSRHPGGMMSDDEPAQLGYVRNEDFLQADPRREGKAPNSTPPAPPATTAIAAAGTSKRTSGPRMAQRDEPRTSETSTRDERSNKRSSIGVGRTFDAAGRAENCQLSEVVQEGSDSAFEAGFRGVLRPSRVRHAARNR